MKIPVLPILICLISFNLMGQSVTEFKRKEDYKKAEPMVLKSCNFLLSNPIDREVPKRTKLFQYVLKWMEGTPDHKFNITPKALNLIGNKSELLPIYLTAMTKVALDNADNPLPSDDIEEKGIDLMIDYCAKPLNNVKYTKGIKKEIKKRGL